VQLAKGRFPDIPTFAADFKRLETQIEKFGPPGPTPKDWDAAYKEFPYHRTALDAVKRYYVARSSSIESDNYGWSKAITEALKTKIADLEKEAAYSNKPIQKVLKQLEERNQMLREKERFLMEEKVTTLLAENPQWAEIIREDIYNMQYNNPLEGTVLEDE